MKKTLLSLSVLAASFAGNTQVYYSAGTAVEFNTIIGGVIDANADSLTWGLIDMATLTPTPPAAISALGEVLIDASYDGVAGITPNDYLILGPFNLVSAAATTTLSWKSASPETTASAWYQEQYSVYLAEGAAGINAIDPAVSNFNTTLTAGQTVFNNNLPLTGFIGAGNDSVFVVIRHHDCFDENFLIIDDIKISNTASLDVDVISSSVFPNPVVNELTIELNGDVAEVVITNLDGKLVSRTTSNKVDVSNLVAGTYIYTVTTSDEKVSTGKFVKK
jgi:hypothetical protein